MNDKTAPRSIDQYLAALRTAMPYVRPATDLWIGLLRTIAEDAEAGRLQRLQRVEP